MRHLRCLCFIRPSADSVQLLVDELREPKYGEYHICESPTIPTAGARVLTMPVFSNIAKKSSLERLAEADDHEVVRVVQEHFADYLVINPDLFALPTPRRIFGSSPEIWHPDALLRTTEGLLSVLLSLKKKPLIRYERNSALCKKLGAELSYQIKNEEQLFDFGRRPDTPPILLLLDRRNDPVTPLLNQWTYQAMVHELLGITAGRVDLSTIPDVRPELKEIVLSPSADPFFAKTQFLNFGDLGAQIKDYVDTYQTKTKSNMNIESIADMKRFVEDYPEFRRLSGNVSKHVTLVGELSRRVDVDSLLEVSELEQSLACNDTHTQDLKALQRMLQQRIPTHNKVLLVALYNLRYGRHQQSALALLLDLLAVAGVPDGQIRSITNLSTYTNSLNQQTALFEPDSIFSRARSGFKGLKGVENVYTQHTPKLEAVLDAVVKGRLKEQTHPFVEGGCREKAQDVIVFIIGGATYEEAKLVAEVNRDTPGVRVVLGGTGVTDTRSFLRGVDEAVIGWDGEGRR